MKTQLHKKCLEIANEKVQILQNNIALAQETANEATKSSAGDKYETTRAMMQIEIANNQKRLLEAQNLQKILQEMVFKPTYSVVSSGALVITDQATFFISVGIGPVLLENEKYLVISPHSPIGALLMGKATGETVVFNQQKFTITAIL
ncbi:MAG TPA: 3-oxoacyl-ACP synthase [Microscillaceae bacterium]|nr:3-oxoacyl-ACP synthase [Microscillaceae bacterium]